MEDSEKSDLLICASEFIKDRLYFVTLRTHEKPKSTLNTHYFTIDQELVYENFYSDFGPLNIAMVYHYCVKLNRKLKAYPLIKKKIVHYTSMDPFKRLNAACLIAYYSIIYLNFTPEQAYKTLTETNCHPFIMFRDASYGVSMYQISLMDCLKAIHKALQLGFFNFNNFNYSEYEYYERVENGDLNWIVPNKFIAFCGPHNKSKLENGYPLHAPEEYFSYFREHNVSTIIRLNKKIYDSNRFKNAGFDHKDLFFTDGSTPNDTIMQQFITICENTSGAVAVHCKAGLGRTGSLIGCYIMKHYKMSAREVIAWIRMCRPGSIIGHQQNWLENKQAQMWKEGELYRKKNGLKGPIKHAKGIYSNEKGTKLTDNVTVTRISHKVDTMKLCDLDEDSCNLNDTKISNITQGDKLNKIKGQRRLNRPALGTAFHDVNKFPLRGRLQIKNDNTQRCINKDSSSGLNKRNGISINQEEDNNSNINNSLTLKKELVSRRCSPRVKLITNNSPRKESTLLKTTVTLINPNRKTIRGSVQNVNEAESIWFGENSDDAQSSKKVINAPSKGKRTKRSLTNERDKASPLGVKVLRRSNTQNVEHEDSPSLVQTAKCKVYPKRQTFTIKMLPAVKNK